VIPSSFEQVADLSHLDEGVRDHLVRELTEIAA
jgi:hypothetical protein